MRAFRSVADTGSFSAAGRALGRSKTVISKLVADLEAHLGTRLLNRTTRRVSLTEAGQVYHARCVQLLSDLEEMESTVRDAQSNPRGRLRVAGPQTFGELYLVPALHDFALCHPGISIELTLTDRFVDLVEERFDLGIRIADLADSSLVARRLGEMRLIACAAPSYLTAHGRPRAPQDLTAHDCIVDTNFRQPWLWPFDGGGRRTTVRVAGRFTVNSARAACELAVAGAGVVLAPNFVADPHLAAGRLEALLPEWTSGVRGIHAVYPHRRHLALRLRMLIDFLAGRFAPGSGQARASSASSPG
jgi:DNA-binding transcriptional LysR family regulator